ncbi:hypothetical protein NDU88_003868 [Pleurodeles waltl]|uniref:Uncharacterized protein n=1 Tax=Pleurodeles waltl TaxID=8319 RepID=A0AAV7VH74_PLEWA|nr:hypothetical protein NDU88_003868 [Pleurodeles waltl]
MGAPYTGVPFEQTSLPLPPHWIRAAWLLCQYRGAAARLHFQGSRGRVSTGLSLALLCLHQDPRGELASELLYVGDSGNNVLEQLSTPQAPLHQPSYMTPRCPSGPGARTGLRGQKLSSLKAGLDSPASLTALIALPPPGAGVRSKRVAKGNTPKLSLPPHL